MSSVVSLRYLCLLGYLLLKMTRPDTLPLLGLGYGACPEGLYGSLTVSDGLVYGYDSKIINVYAGPYGFTG